MGMEPTKDARIRKNATLHAEIWICKFFLFGQIDECALKGIVKDHTERTQRRPDNFAEQCAIQEYESNVIKYVMTYLSHQLGSSGHGANRGIAKFDSQGKFTACFSKANSRGIGISPDKII